jgi:hypothetical protein
MIHPNDPVFRALATTIVPEARQLSEPEWVELVQLIDHALAKRPRSLRRKLEWFVRILNFLPLLRWGRPFTRLDEPARYQFLHSLEVGPAAALRKGLWGLRTLVLLGYYARPGVAQALGYRASKTGWTQPRPSA